MCMAIPSLVTELDVMSATVECFGVAREVSLALMSEPVAVGDYVLVRSGRYVVERIDRDSALETLSLMELVLDDGGALATQHLGLSCVGG
jgi:hydrogenase expression/formation protein HypC